jgi:hypothetical protein
MNPVECRQHLCPKCWVDHRLAVAPNIHSGQCTEVRPFPKRNCRLNLYLLYIPVDDNPILSNSVPRAVLFYDTNDATNGQPNVTTGRQRIGRYSIALRAPSDNELGSTYGFDGSGHRDWRYCTHGDPIFVTTSRPPPEGACSTTTGLIEFYPFSNKEPTIYRLYESIFCENSGPNVCLHIDTGCNSIPMPTPPQPWVRGSTHLVARKSLQSDNPRWLYPLLQH